MLFSLKNLLQKKIGTYTKLIKTRGRSKILIYAYKFTLKLKKKKQNKTCQ